MFGIGKKHLSTAVYIGLILLGVLFYNIFGNTVSGDGPTMYVARNGSDSSGDGSEGNPLATLEKAAETAVPGTTIFVRGGIYERTKQVFSAQGTADEPIVIRPFPGETAVFDGQGADIGEAESIIKISHARHIIFEGFEIRNSAARGLSVYESEHIIVRQNRVHDTVERGLGGGGHHLLFEGNEIWRASLENENEAFNARGGWKAGLSTYRLANGNPSTHITIRNNHIHDNWGEGIIAIFAENVVIEGNRLHDNYSVNLYLDNAHHVRVEKNHLYTTTSAYNRRDKNYPAHGIHMANERYSSPTDTQISNVLIANNLIVGTGRGISFWHDSSNNDSSNRYQGVEVVYNVVQGTHDHAVWFDSVEASSDNQLHNNIIFAGQNGRLLDINNSGDWTISHNNWPDRVPGIGDEPHSFSAQPNFINPDPTGPAIGYQLQPGDRSIQAGLPIEGIASDFWGKPRSFPPSLGIHEFGTAGEPPEPAPTEPPTQQAPTETPTNVPPTATPTELPPTATATELPPTEQPPTATATTLPPTEAPPTATATELPPTASPEPTDPAATAVPTDPAPTTTAVPPTPTSTVAAPQATPATSTLLYLSSSSGGTVAGIEFADEDVLTFDFTTQAWQLLFDGSDVGLRRDIDAVAALDNGRLLLSLDKSSNVPGLGRVDDSDILLFVPDSLGTETNGRFVWFIDGSDIGLTESEEDIDGITLLPNGRLLISTSGSFEVDGPNGEIEGKDEDLLLFTPTALGEETAGVWEFYFDGSDVGYDKDIWGVWLEPFSNTLYLTTKNGFDQGNLAITSRDIFACRPRTLGETTNCIFAPTLFWQGRSNGFDERIDAIGMVVPIMDVTAVTYQYLTLFPKP